MGADDEGAVCGKRSAPDSPTPSMRLAMSDDGGSVQMDPFTPEDQVLFTREAYAANSFSAAFDAETLDGSAGSIATGSSADSADVSNYGCWKSALSYGSRFKRKKPTSNTVSAVDTKSTVQKHVASSASYSPVLTSVSVPMFFVIAALEHHLQNLINNASGTFAKPSLVFWNPCADACSDLIGHVVRGFGHVYLQSGNTGKTDFIHPNAPYLHPKFDSIDVLICAPSREFFDNYIIRAHELWQSRKRKNTQPLSVVLFGDTTMMFGETRGSILCDMNLQPTQAACRVRPDNSPRAYAALFPRMNNDTFPINLSIEIPRHDICYGDIVEASEKSGNRVPTYMAIMKAAMARVGVPEREFFVQRRKPKTKKNLQDAKGEVMDDVPTPGVFAALAISRMLLHMRDSRSVLKEPWRVLDPCTGPKDGKGYIKTSLLDALCGLFTTPNVRVRSKAGGFDVLKLGTPEYPLESVFHDGRIPDCIVTHPPQSIHFEVTSHLVSLQKRYPKLTIAVFCTAPHFFDSYSIRSLSPSFAVAPYGRTGHSAVESRAQVEMMLSVWAGDNTCGPSGMLRVNACKTIKEPSTLAVGKTFQKMCMQNKIMDGPDLVAGMNAEEGWSGQGKNTVMAKQRILSKESKAASLREVYIARGIIPPPVKKEKKAVKKKKVQAETKP